MNQPPRRRRLLLTVLTMVIVAIGAWGYIQWTKKSAVASLANGRQYLKERRAELAEKAIGEYLAVYPDDVEAILNWAEAVIDGKSRLPQDAARVACEALSRIPDSSPFAAEARMREGRLTLFVLLQPERAEKLLMHSRTLNPDSMDVHFLLWKLFDLTERFQFAEEHFWNTYDRSPDSIKTERLVEWYLSQFSTNSGNATIDRLLGFLPADQQTSDTVVAARLDGFLASEPDSTLNLTAKAAFLLHLRDREAAGKLLDQAEQREDAASNPFFLATRISHFLDLGKLREAKDLFDRWNAPNEGYLYLKTLGRIQQLVLRQDKEAVESFEQATKIWPGPMDWSILHFQAQSMARLGNRTGAEQTRARAKEIELLMELDVHRRLRMAIQDLKRPESFVAFEEFYLKLGSERDAAAWQSRRQALSVQ